MQVLTRISLLAVAATLLLLGTLAGDAPANGRPLETGILDYEPWYSSESALAFSRTKAAGANVAKIYVNWWDMVPNDEGARKPANFNAADPTDPGYDWGGFDQQVRGAVSHGLEPMLLLTSAPVWAEGKGEKPEGIRVRGTREPNAKEYGLFALAAARRYSGNFQGIPRVRLWQAWNEPNVWANLTPQYDQRLSKPVRPGSRPVSPVIYRRLLNRFAAAVHRVHADNLVVTGGMAPFGAADAGRHRVPPMTFMRKLLCMSAKNKPLRRCTRPAFDVWSHHPYTEGGPFHKAQSKENVSLGDMPRMRRLLAAAIRARHIATKRKVKFWVTEFAWDTDPPDPNGLPLKLHGRWTAEALYQMWRNGVSHVTWFKLRDDANFGFPDAGVTQSGLYTRCRQGLRCDQPKPAVNAFRFPFVAYRSKRGLHVWGRTPTSTRGALVIEQRRSGGWRRLAGVSSDGHGIFQRRRIRLRGRGPVRARLAGETGPLATSPTFSLKRPKDRPTVIS